MSATESIYCSKCGACNLKESESCLRCNNKLQKESTTMKEDAQQNDQHIRDISCNRENKNITMLNKSKSLIKKPLRPPLSIFNEEEDEKKVSQILMPITSETTYNIKHVGKQTTKMQIMKNKRSRINVSIVNGKKIIKTFWIHGQNVASRCKQLMEETKGCFDYGIVADVNHRFVNKEYEQLLLMVSVHVSLSMESYYAFFSFLVDEIISSNRCMDRLSDAASNAINNAIFLFQVVFRNHRMMNQWLNDAYKYETFFKCLRAVMDSKFIVHPKYKLLLQIMASTYCYWDCNHIQYLCDIGGVDSISIALKHAYYHNNKSRAPEIGRIMVGLLHYADCLIQQGEEDHCDIMSYIFLKIVSELQFMDRRKKATQHYAKKMKKILSKTQGDRRYRFEEPEIVKAGVKLTWKNNNVFKQPYRKSKRKYIIKKNLKYMNFIKICANYKCNKFKIKGSHRTKSKSFKMQKCKRCQCVNYCCRKCQKYHWKHEHRFHCDELKKKHENVLNI